MDAWNTYELQSVCSRLSSGKGIRAKEISETGKYPVYGGNGIRGYTNAYNFDGECAVIGRQGANCGNVRFFSGKAYMTEHAVVVCANENNHTRFLSYLLSTMQLGRLSGQSAQPGLAVKTLGIQPVCVPKLDAQKRIASVLGALDDKIALNQQINKNLEEQAQEIFNKYFIDVPDIPDGWSEGSLTDIADYLNGLAMQKFPPMNNADSLPVLKIKELRQGMCDSDSDRCSVEIKPDYIIQDGDVIFSWSGSLLVDFWCGGDCGLNQHLFKVSSAKYDKWFYYSWTIYHLQEFVRMAADRATTMGHIKRDALEKARVLIPCHDDYVKIGNLLQPLYNLIITNRIENRRLANLRDALLPRLMSGEIDVSGIEI